jgi:hypothetical protein
MCGTINPGHTYDEYMVLLAKLGMTRADQTWVAIPPCVDSLLWYSICRGHEAE